MKIPVLWWKRLRIALDSTSPPPEPRLNLWAFSGQRNNPERDACVATLSRLPGGFLNVTEGFGQGIAYPEYVRLLTDTAIVPSPSGLFTPDCFRTWEALEAGCLPVVNAQSPRDDRHYPGGYYSWLMDEEVPFPQVDSWEELPGLVEHYAENPLGLLVARNRAGAWWALKKRELQRIGDRIFDVTGQRPPDASGLRSKVTVLMPTSPIPSNPSLDVIEKAIDAVRSYPDLSQCEVIVMVDGVRNEQADRRPAYEEFKRRLIWKCHHEWHGVLPLAFDTHMHQAGMAREALKLVETDFVFYVEHDTWPCGEIDFEGIVQALARYAAPKLVRLHHIDRIHPEHEYLMIGDGPEVYGLGEGDDIRLWPTQQWSQRPHLASTDYYRWIIDEHFGTTARTMIEDVMHAVVVNQLRHHKTPWEKFGVCVYIPEGEDIRRSNTADGRGEDPKYPMHYAYDGHRPVGAPGGAVSHPGEKPR